MQESSDQPIALLRFNQAEGAFLINPEGIEFLKTIDSPLAIVGVAGMYRTGKSYLLNRVLLSREDGFGVGPTVNPCTKGLWLWGSALSGQTSSGEDCKVLIMDSEGIGALDEDADHDTRIFALVILISSIFLYNSVGAIDENALQNLSLVVNLTKHIHIKSSEEEIDSQDYAAYFPGFFWVLRDFALQLVDSEGEALTSKEYLERALEQQKGFSDIIEEKNRIRRLLKEFFPDRDCFTLVRPVTKEEDLQNLAFKHEDELRPEFMEQVYTLRDKVFKRAKIKAIHGKPLNGEMVAALIESYVEALNKGVAPSIENTWAYICKSECGKALKEAENLYDSLVVNEANPQLPIGTVALRDLHKAGKEAAVELFTKIGVGEEKDSMLKKLMDKLSEKYSLLKEKNVVKMQDTAEKFLQENYSSLDDRIRKGELKTFLEFEKEMRNFYDFFIAHGPEGPHKKEIILAFVQNKLVSIADYFLKDTTNELQLQKEMHEMRMQNVQNEIKEIKETHMKEKTNWSIATTVIETEKAQASAAEAELRNSLQEAEKREKDLKGEKKSVEDRLESSLGKYEELEAKLRELERTLFQKEADFSQERELNDKKNKYLEDSLQEMRNKEKDYLNQIKELKKEHSDNVRDLQNKHDSQMQETNKQLEKETEKTQELEREVETKENELENKRQDWEKEEQRLREIIQDLTTQLEAAKQALKDKEDEYQQKIIKDKQERESAISLLKEKVGGLEQHLKDKENNIKILELSIQKDTAMLTQKIEFLNQHSEELKNQLESEREQHSNIFKTLSQSPSDKEEAEAQMERLRTKHMEDIKELEQMHEEALRNNTAKIDTLQQKYNELEVQHAVESTENKAKTQSLEAELFKAHEEKTKAVEELDKLQNEKSKSSQEEEARLQEKIRTLEQQLFEVMKKHQEEMKESSEKANLTLSQLKEFYEEQKERLEKKAQEDKERADKKYSQICEEYEDRIRHETETFEDDLAAKEEELREMESYYNEEVTRLKHQSDLDKQKLESTEKYLNDIQKQIDASNSYHAQALEQQEQRLNAEKSLISDKLDRLTQEVNFKDKEINSLQAQKELAEEQMTLSKKEIDGLKAESNADRDQINSKYEALKDSYQKLSDEYTAKKSDFKRELALCHQEIEFKTNRLDNLEKNLQESDDKYTESLRQIKEETTQELSSTITKLTRDKEDLENKLEQRRKAAKDSSATTSKQIHSLEKEKAVLSEKVVNLEGKISEIQGRLVAETEALASQLKEKTENENTDKLSVQLENERLKTLLQEIEKEVNEKQAAYEREKVLWENKFNFLVQQRDSARADQAESQRKFDSTLQHLHKRKVSDKEKLEQTTNSLMKTIENPHQAQIRELQDTHALEINEHNDKIKELENHIKKLSFNIENENSKRDTANSAIDSRINELQESEFKMNSEIEKLRQEKESNLDELRNVRQKVKEVEKRAKEAENQMSKMFIEHEKERARWNLQISELSSSKTELTDALVRAEKRRENLTKESEKMKLRKSLSHKRKVAGE